MKDIPTAEDFYSTGKELLNFSWDVVAELMVSIHDYEMYYNEELEESTEYWAAAKRRLSTALSTTQQGIEFILKGKIVEISPYLLIVDPPNKWPSPYKSDLSFTDFRTIDAQDLVKVNDTFSKNQFSAEFINQFHSMREKRNKIIHSVDKKLVVNVIDVIRSILFMHKELFPQEAWTQVRLNHLENEPHIFLGSIDYVRSRICKEVGVVIDLLIPSEVKKYFKIDKKQKSYQCPDCYSETPNHGEKTKLAVLTPKGQNSKTLYCPVCDKTYEVIREECKSEYCSENVLDQEGHCLSCIVPEL
ncbi:hypothetical protein [Gimesia maris]|tara:strand:- start:4727 stop:5632 length:906 start_codon:yes stop_codon:yes gene_type:complete